MKVFEDNFEKMYGNMQQHKMALPTPPIQVLVAQAKEHLRDVMSHFLRQEGKTLIWLPEYDKVADWLTDNKGRGLFLYGQCGRGKSLLCRYVLPAILLHHCRKVVTVLDMQQLNKNIDFALSKQLLSLDDVGTEEYSVHFGERRLAFAEVMDAAEKHSKLLIVSSNLGADGISKAYGERTLDRVKATTHRIMFVGNSLRQ